MRQDDILVLEIFCNNLANNFQFKKIDAYPFWEIITDLNHDETSWSCDLLVTYRDFSKIGDNPDVPSFNYHGKFSFHSTQKTGHFELEYTIPSLALGLAELVYGFGKLVIRVPVDIEPVPSEASSQ